VRKENPLDFAFFAFFAVSLPRNQETRLDFEKAAGFTVKIRPATSSQNWLSTRDTIPDTARRTLDMSPLAQGQEVFFQ
jgi:hypothetical protein